MINYKSFFLIKILVVIAIVLIQSSFLNLVFPATVAPNLILVSVVALVITVGLEKAWWGIIFIGIITDLIQNQMFGFSSIYFVLMSSMVNFFSRFFVINKALYGKGMVLVILTIVTILDSLLSLGRHGTMVIWQVMAWKLPLNIVCFYAVYFILKKTEKYLIFKKHA